VHRRLLRPALLLAALASLAACSPFYVLRAGYEEARILSRRAPIARIVDDPRTPEPTRQKLMLVLEARDFAARELELSAGKSYTTYSELDSDTLILVLSAARKDRFEPYTWWFPIVGNVPYKGYFAFERAARDRARLEERGYDAALRPAAAFSTLGWFNDPVVSTLLRHDDVSLVNTVIHEILHNTYYAPGEAAFNESLANFVGGRGAILFFCSRGDEERCATARGLWHDDLLFGRFLAELVGELEELYGRGDLAREEILSRREEIFAAARVRFRAELRPELRVARYDSFEREPINNATLLARRLYYQRLDLFEEVYLRYAGDLHAAVHGILSAVRGADDPFAALDAWLALPPAASAAAARF
jgi:predicted aminopeptidase